MASRPSGHSLAGVAVAVAALIAPLWGGSATAAGVTLPPVNGQFDYQIGGAYAPASTVTVVDRDRLVAPVAGKYTICYVNVFQTQGAETAGWESSHPTLLVKNSKGKFLRDPDWPDEDIFDTSTAAKRSAIAAVEGSWIDGCAKAGFKAIEPDNLDSYTRTGVTTLTKADNVALAALLAHRAHADGLAFAQKNDTDITAHDKATVGFDFAIAEECGFYSECDAYTGLYGNHVIEIEYTDNGKSAYTKACTARGSTLSIIYRDRDVVAKGQRGYHYEYC